MEVPRFAVCHAALLEASGSKSTAFPAEVHSFAETIAYACVCLSMHGKLTGLGCAYEVCSSPDCLRDVSFVITGNDPR
eukprot:5915766-Amphidinium_carterae.1